MEEYVRKNCNLTESSIKQYLLCLKKLKRELKYDDDDLFFLKDTKKVGDYLEKTYDNKANLKKYYTLCFSVIKNSNEFTDTEKKFYQDRMLKYRDIVNENIKQNKLTPKQEENWLPWSKIGELPKKIKKELKKTKKEDPSYLNKYQFYLIALLYTQLPPLRLDYHNVKVRTTPLEFTDENYILISNKKAKLFMNQFKNVKKIGKVEMEYPKDIAREIIKYWKFVKEKNLNNDFLFTDLNNHSESMDSNKFGRVLNKIFFYYLGKDISVNTLRHIYETEAITSPDYSKKTIKEKEEIHKKLLHSFNTAQEYVKLSPFIKMFDGETEEKPKKISINDKEKIKELLNKIGVELE